MKEIKKEYLENIKEEYLKNDLHTIARHALYKTNMSDIANIQEATEYNRNYFSIDLKTLPVANQKRSGRCWIFAGLNVLREKIAKKYNLEKFELSQNYVAFWDKLEKANYTLEAIINMIDRDKFDRELDFILTNGVGDGGQWDLFVNLIEKYGVVPQDAYPETYQSSNTSRVDWILNRYIRKFTYEVRKLYEEKGESSLAEINERKDKSIKEIYQLLCSCFGVPPTKFIFEFEDKDKKYHIEKDITPKEFLEKYVEFNPEDYISIINAPTDDKPFNKAYTVKLLGNVIEGKQVKYLNLEMNRFKQLVISQLKDNEPVWFGSDCLQDGNTKDGIWDDNYFDFDRIFDIDTSMPKDAVLDTRESAMNHAMVLTGVNLEDDKPTKWKVENSWGEKDVGFKGYYTATDTWFDKNVFQAVVNKKYLSETERKILNQEPIVLAPWDPMGTLA